jgi:hypothetical protein
VIGEKEAGVKHDSLVGRTFSKFIRYLVALGEVVILAYARHLKEFEVYLVQRS